MRIYSFSASGRFSSVIVGLFLLFGCSLILNCKSSNPAASSSIIRYDAWPYRERISINDGWRFMRYKSGPDKLIYDERPGVNDNNEGDSGNKKQIIF